jgi:hypothetical protein
LFGRSHACRFGKSSIKKMNVEHWWDNAGKGRPNIRKGTCSIATLSTINSHGLARQSWAER